MEEAQSRGHEASPQSGLGVGCKRCSSSKKLRGLSARAQARRISIYFFFVAPHTQSVGTALSLFKDAGVG